MAGIVYLQRQKIQCCYLVSASADRKNIQTQPVFTICRSLITAVKPKPVIVKTKLITREGYNALKAEHDELWFKKRPEVTKIVTWAASFR